MTTNQLSKLKFSHRMKIEVQHVGVDFPESRMWMLNAVECYSFNVCQGGEEESLRKPLAVP